MPQTFCGEPLSGGKHLHDQAIFTDCLTLMVGNDRKRRTAQFARRAKKRRDFALPRFHAVQRVGDLDQADNPAVPHEAEVYVEGLVLVVEDFRVAVLILLQ